MCTLVAAWRPTRTHGDANEQCKGSLTVAVQVGVLEEGRDLHSVFPGLSKDGNRAGHRHTPAPGQESALARPGTVISIGPFDPGGQDFGVDTRNRGDGVGRRREDGKEAGKRDRFHYGAGVVDVDSGS